MPPRLRDYRWPLVISACLAACLFAQSPNFRLASGPQASPYAGDFLQEWVGGWIVRAGDRDRLYELPYVYDLQHDAALVGFAWNDDQYLPIVYPPFYYLLVSPLSLFNVQVAAWIWAALMFAALFASCRIASGEFSRRRHDGPSDGSPRDRIAGLLPWMLPVSLLFMPVIESFSSSQKGTLCLLFFTGTFVLWQRGKNFPAGLVFGLLAFKPQLTLIIALAALWKRDWRFVAGGLTSGVALVGLSLLVGVKSCEDYLRFALGAGDYMQTSGYDLWKSHTIWGFGKLLAPDDNRLASIVSLALASVVGYCIVRLVRSTYKPETQAKGTPRSGGLGSGEGWYEPLLRLRFRLVWVSKRRLGGWGSQWDTTDQRFRLQFAGLVVATLLVSPHLFTYDLTIVLLPVAIVVFATAQSTGFNAALRRSSLALTALLFASPAISVSVAVLSGVQITVPLLLAYLAWIAVAYRRAVMVAHDPSYNSRCGVHCSRTIEVTRGSIAVGDDALTLPSP